MISLPEKFIERMKNILGGSFGDFLSSYDRAPYKAIRINTLKLTAEEFTRISPFNLKPVPWEKNGFYVDTEKAGKTVLHAAGLYYVQEPSAMSAAPELHVKRGEKVLDLCSAPGGKGTQLAQEMRGDGVIVMNEINYARAQILSRNVERLGITNAAVICADPQKIAEHFKGYFDKVLVDAPCSGEGMFLKEPESLSEWSLANIELCARRQQTILDCAQAVLKPNGLMVYSTCTFAPEEDELQVENFLKKYKNFELVAVKKLYPHECAGEGHFVAVLKKTDGETGCVPPFKISADRAAVAIYRQTEAETLKGKRYGNIHEATGGLYSVMDECPSLPFSILRLGTRLCEVKKDRVELDHALATSLTGENAPSIDLDENTALNYLRGLTFDCPQNLKGWALATYLGYPLGWCKAVNGTAKNHLPKGIRI